jgi:hypothetical protein
MFEAADVHRCAHEMRPYLNELLGSDAPVVDDALADLIKRADADEKVDNLMLEVFGRHKATREWARRYLQGDEDPADIMKDLRQYIPPPGGSLPVPASGSKYRCPKGDFQWAQQFLGQSPPLCPTHKVPLDLEVPTP